MTRKAAIFALALLGAAAPAGAWAQGRGNPGQQPAEASSPKADAPPPKAKAPEIRVSIAQAEAAIRQQVPGRRIEARTEQTGNGAQHFIKWSTEDGRRIDFIVDAQTGRIQRSGG